MSIYDTLNEQQEGGGLLHGWSASDPCGSGIGKDESADAQDCILIEERGRIMEYPGDHVYEQGGRGDAGACG